MKNKIKMLAGTAALAVLLFASVPAMAATDSTAANASGFYVGAFGGWTWNDTDAPLGVDLGVDGSDWGLFAGYDLTGLFQSGNTGLTAAIELHYAWSTADDSSALASIDKNNEWGISLRPGLTALNMNGIKPYGIIGYSNTEFETTTAGGTVDDDFDGLELGVGVEVPVFNNFGVRVDYAHVFYGSEGGTDPDGDNLRFGAAYHF